MFKRVGMETNLASGKSVRGNSPLSATQWRALAILADEAKKAVDGLWFGILMNAGDTSDAEMQSKLLEYAERAKSAADTISGFSYMLTPQTEWLGGDSSNPHSHILREPNIMGLRRLTVQE